MLRAITFWCLSLALVLAACRTAEAASLQDTLLALVDQMEAGYAAINDYTAVFQKHERVENKLMPRESIYLKFQKPFKVYMRWLDVPSKEAIYVKGENNNKVVAHCAGLLGLWTWSFSPRDPALLQDNRHDITEIGMGFVIEMMRVNIPKAIEHAEVEVMKIVDEVFEGRPTTMVEARFTPKPPRKYYTSRMVTHIDKEYRVPIGIACYDEQGQLEEQYAYKDLKVNVGLTGMDFSRKNKQYKF